MATLSLCATISSRVRMAGSVTANNPMRTESGIGEHCLDGAGGPQHRQSDAMAEREKRERGRTTEIALAFGGPPHPLGAKIKPGDPAAALTRRSPAGVQGASNPEAILQHENFRHRHLRLRPVIRRRARFLDKPRAARLGARGIRKSALVPSAVWADLFEFSTGRCPSAGTAACPPPTPLRP